MFAQCSRIHPPATRKRDTAIFFLIYVDTNRQWRWRLKSANGKIIADSGESYWNKADCLHAINLVKASHSAPVRE